MKSSSFLILNAFLNKLSSEDKAHLINFLPEKDQKRLQDLVQVPSLLFKWFSFEWLLSYVHYSWLLPTLKLYSKDASLFLSSLENEEATHLEKKMNAPPSSYTLSPIGKLFFKRVLLQSLVGGKNHLLPIEALPESELNILCKFSKKELVELIDYLSLYDLAIEIRQIVETKILKKIYSFLSEGQKKFIKTIMTQKELLPLHRLGLDRWDGNEETLHHLLHRRGLARLGIALSSEHPDLTWYVCHILDIGRGNALSKAYQNDVSSNIISQIRQSIMELVPLIYTRSS